MRRRGRVAKRLQLAIVVSIGKWGGIYGYRGFGFRLCLGRIALTVLPLDGDAVLASAAKNWKREAAARVEA